jgi:predicted neuraminidase
MEDMKGQTMSTCMQLAFLLGALLAASCDCGEKQTGAEDAEEDDAPDPEDAPDMADVVPDGDGEADPEPDPPEDDGDGDGEEASDVHDEEPPSDGDRSPPLFRGLTAAFPCDGRVVLEWRAAEESESPPVTYSVYMRESSGTYDWGSPVLTTDGLGAAVEGLSNGVEYGFVVRASDAAGNEDDNTLEVTASPLIQYPLLPHRELIYEINPELLPSCHSSCIVELPGGELLTIWYCGESEHTPDVAIWGSRRLVGADTWTFPEVIQDTPDLPDGNDVLYLGEDGKLWLFWALQVAFEWPSAVIKVRVSDDFGHTWGPVYDLGTPGGYLPRTHPIRIDNGWIIIPLYVEYTASAVAVRSENGGFSWESPATILSFLGTQPTVIQRSDLSLFALMRSGAPPQKSWQARSTDRGLTWSERALSDLDNPGSSLEMVMLESGSVAVAFNNSTTSRSNLSLGLSYDGGASWTHIRTVEDNPATGYDYPSIIQDHCGLIHVSYSYDGRRSIAHFVTEESWIEGD